MAKKKNVKAKPVKSIGPKKTREQLMEETARNENVSSSLVNDILNQIVSLDVMPKLLRRGDTFNIPGVFMIFIKKKKIIIPKSQAQRRREYERKPEVRKKKQKARQKRRRMLASKRRWYRKNNKWRKKDLKYHNMWRELNGIKPGVYLIAKDTNLYMRMPDKRKIAKRYNSVIKNKR